MKKISLFLLFLLIANNVYANGKILKNGFITKTASVKKGMDIKDPKNVSINKYQNKINDVKNDKIKRSLIELTKVFKEKWKKLLFL